MENILCDQKCTIHKNWVVYIYIYLFVCLFVCLFIFLFIYLFIYLFISMVYVGVWNQNTRWGSIKDEIDGIL